MDTAILQNPVAAAPNNKPAQNPVDDYESFKQQVVARYKHFLEQPECYRGYLVTITFDPVACFKRTAFERMFERQIAKATTYCWNALHEAILGQRQAKSLRSKGMAGLDGFMIIERQTKENDYAGAHLHGVYFVSLDQVERQLRVQAALEKHFQRIWGGACVDIRDVYSADGISYALKSGLSTDGIDHQWIDTIDPRIAGEPVQLSEH
jgi:hypothetical protein